MNTKTNKKTSKLLIKLKQIKHFFGSNKLCICLAHGSKSIERMISTLNFAHYLAFRSHQLSILIDSQMYIK